MYKHIDMTWYPIDIKKKDLKLAKVLVTQYGGPAGELGAALRYLNQSFYMPDERGRKLLTDIATEELGHVEMICLMYDALTQGASIEEMKAAGIDAHYAQHGREIFMQDANGVPFNVFNFGAMGDCLADLSEDMAAEEKARATYEHIMDLTKDEDVLRILAFLRERELVHFAMFKELYEYYKSKGIK